jgi:hypothetical protein
MVEEMVFASGELLLLQVALLENVPSFPVELNV